MKKNVKNVLAMAMSAITITSSIFGLGSNAFASSITAIEESANKGINANDYEGIKSGMINTKEYNYLTLNESMEEDNGYYEEYTNIKEFYNSPIEAEVSTEDVYVALPKTVDISKSEYFPEVGDQGSSGSCWHFGTSYACLTYANNKARGIKTTPENTINPMFCYNYAAGTKNSSLDGLLQQIGYPAVGVLPIDTKNTLSLYPIKEVWESAVRNRGGQYISYNCFGDEDEVVTSPDDPSIYVLKKKLSEGNLAAISSYSYSWNYSVVASGEHKGEVVVDRCDINKTGGHITALVGYDDNIWVDINYDGKVQEAEMGAFKMVNSWGKDWANDGFVWIAYDALNKTSQVLTAAEEARINKAIDAGTIKANKVNNSVRRSFFMYKTYSNAVVRDRISSECLVYMTVNTGSRREMTMSVTATNKKDGKATEYVMPNYAGEAGKKNLAWDGTAYSTDATMVFDLDNVIFDITPETMEDYDWKVYFKDDTLDECSVTVKDVYFTVNGVKKYVTDISKVPLNGSSKTYKMDLRTADRKVDPAITQENKNNVVIYYNNSNYSDSLVHYKVGTNSWTTAPGMQMSRTDEQSGYKWKYVINLGSSSELKLCFNNGNGTWDNNGSKDYTISGAGCYGIKSGKITKLIETVDKTEPLIELDKSNVNLKVSEGVIVTPTVIDGSVNDIEWSSSDEKVATVVSGKITAVSEGIATITAKIGEVKAICEVKVEKKEETLKAILKVDGVTTSFNKKVGETVTLTTLVTGGSEKYTYTYKAYNGSKWVTLKSASAVSSFTDTLTSVGYKKYVVVVKDSVGTTVDSNKITVTATPSGVLSGALKVNNSTSNQTLEVGSSVTLKITAAGGSGKYTYTYKAYNGSKWVTLKSASTASTFTDTLTSVGYKKYVVVVKDSTGTTVDSNKITVTAKAISGGTLTGTLKVNGGTSSTTLKVGDTIKITASATGGSGSYTYAFKVYNGSKWITLQNYSTNKTYEYVLTNEGNMRFVVVVKDSKGITVDTNKINVTIK